jgi:hypothetical protein
MINGDSVESRPIMGWFAQLQRWWEPAFFHLEWYIFWDKRRLSLIVNAFQSLRDIMPSRCMPSCLNHIMQRFWWKEHPRKGSQIFQISKSHQKLHFPHGKGILLKTLAYDLESGRTLTSRGQTSDHLKLILLSIGERKYSIAWARSSNH